MSLLADTIPVEVIVRGRRCVVIGAGGEALSKIERLLRGGARVAWFPEGAPLDDGQRAGALGEGVTRVARPFEDRDASDAAIVFVATEHEAIGERLAKQARELGTLVCTLDRPLASTFVNPAVAEKSGLRLAVSTGGASPALASRLREELERLLDTRELGAFVQSVAEERAALPPGERAAPMRERVAGLRIEGRIVVPNAPE